MRYQLWEAPLPKHNALSYERFAAAADALVALGTKPSALSYRALRDKVGGSNSTIAGFLKTYKGVHPEVPPLTSLSAELIAALQSAFAQQRSMIEGELQERISQGQVQHDELLADLVAKESELEARTDELIQLTTERDLALGQVAQLNGALAERKLESTAALEKLGKLEQYAAVTESKLHETKGHIDELRQQTESQLSVMRLNVSELNERNCGLQERLKESEVSLAQVKAQLDAERAATTDLKGRLNETAAALQDFRRETVKAAVDANEVDALKAQLTVVLRENATLQSVIQVRGPRRQSAKQRRAGN